MCQLKTEKAICIMICYMYVFLSTLLTTGRVSSAARAVPGPSRDAPPDVSDEPAPATTQSPPVRKAAEAFSASGSESDRPIAKR